MKDFKQTTIKIIERVGCEYEVFTSENSPQEVERAYFKALEEGKEKGFMPLLVVSDDTLLEYLEIMEDEKYSREATLTSNVDAKKFLTENYNEYVEDLEIDEDMLEFMEEADVGPTEHFMAYQSYRGDGIEEVILFRIPVKEPWELIAWLPMGGWNECPCPEDMMAVAKYWYEEHGAWIATVSHDIVEFYVPDKVEDNDKAMKLAKEMYSFCPDCIEQGMGSLELLKENIKASNVWFFWWD